MRHEDEFHNRKLTSGKMGKRGVCKFCKKIIVQLCINKNRKEYNIRSRLRSKTTNITNKLNIIDYLLTHPCIDCGQSNPLLLDFDHKNPSTKKKHVSAMLGKYCWCNILKEISKCDVRCAYCHRIKTIKQLGYLTHVDPKYFVITWHHS